MEKLKPHFGIGGTGATNMQKMQMENNLKMGYPNQGMNRHDNCDVKSKKGKRRCGRKMI